MNILYTTRTSPWEDQPNTEELKELEYTQLEEAKGGNGGNNTSVPINEGIIFVLIAVLIFGFLYTKKWKLSRI